MIDFHTNYNIMKCRYIRIKELQNTTISQTDFQQTYNPIPVGADERAEEVDNCIYDGYLMNEKDVYVTMAGCANSDNFQVKIHNKNYCFNSIVK